MADLQRNNVTFNDGVPGDLTAAKLHALVDQATILPGFFTDRSQVTPVLSDFITFLSNNTFIRKCTFTNLNTILPYDQAAGTASRRTLGPGASQAAPGNDTRFPATVNGIRVGVGAGSNDRAYDVNDGRFQYVDVSATNIINWDLSDTFYCAATFNHTYTFSNLPSFPRTIIFLVQSNGHNIVFSGCSFTAPVMIGVVTLFTFTRVGGLVL